MRNASPRSRWFILAIFTFIVLFLITRLVNLTSFPLFVDEGRHIIRAQITLTEDPLIGVKYLKGLYVWLVAAALPFFDDRLLAARLVTVLVGLGCAFVCYLLAEMLYPRRRLGYLSALFYLLCPFALFFDRLALTDNLLALLMGLSILLSVQLWRTPTFKWAVLLGIGFSLAALTKFYAFLYYISPILLGFALDKKIGWRKIGPLLAVSYGITLLVSLPMVIIGQESFWRRVLRWNNHVSEISTTSTTPGFLDSFWQNFSLALDWLAIYLTWPFLLIVLLTTVMIVVKRAKIGYVLLILILIPIVTFSLFIDGWFSRYLLPVIVPISVVVAWGIDTLAGLALTVWPKLSRQGLALMVFFVAGIPALVFDYTIIFKPADAPLPQADRGDYIEGRFSGYGLKESAQIVEQMLEQYPELILLRGSNLMDTIFSLDVIGMTLHLPNSAKISTRIIGDFDANTLNELNTYAQDAPTLTLGTMGRESETHPVLSRVSHFPQAWRLGSFPKPGERFTVELYQWLSPPDFALHWFQQGGDPDPRVALLDGETLVTAAGGTLVDWPQPQTPTFEALESALATAQVEYILATHELVESQVEILGPYMTTDGALISLKKLPPNWRLAFAYPTVQCQWCLFQLRPPTHPVKATFGEKIELEGYDISATEFAAGDSVYLTLYWHSLDQISERYSVFVRVLNEENEIVGQSDTLPLQGNWPTDQWPAGAKLADQHALKLDPSLPAGEYTVAVGLHTPEDLQPLLPDPEQAVVVADAVILTTISVR